MIRCPRCTLPAPIVSVVEVDDVEANVHQCETCIVRTNLLGVECDVALTFVVDPATGRPLDPQTLEPIDPAAN